MQMPRIVILLDAKNGTPSLLHREISFEKNSVFSSVRAGGT